MMVCGKKLKTAFFLAGFGLVSIINFGCSSVKPMPSEHKGLFDQLSETHPGRRARPEKSDEIMDDEEAEKIRPAVAGWRWPLKRVAVTSPYGRRGSDFHEGVDLKAARGTPVYAASQGSVVYAGSKIRGYGKMVVLKHAGDLTTVYAHNNKLLVKKGQRIKKGQQIAWSGNTGRSSGPHLHFEIRKGTAAINPSLLLGSRPQVVAESERPKKIGRSIATADR